MNAPRDLGPEFRAWLHDAPVVPDELRQRTLRQTSTTRQRRRWLWFLPGPKPTAGAGDQRGRGQAPASTTTRRELLLAPTGGTTTMFSATKVVGLAAVVALFGALLLARPITAPQDLAISGAPAITPGEITPFEGTLRVLGQDNMGVIVRYDWGTTQMGEQWTVRMETDDPQMSGVSTGYHNVYAVGPDDTDLRTYNARLFTKEGSWLETGRGYQDPHTTGIHYQTYMTGEGAYEGLSAIRSCGQETFSPVFRCEGVIFEGGLPEAPADAPDEIPSIHFGP